MSYASELEDRIVAIAQEVIAEIRADAATSLKEAEGRASAAESALAALSGGSSGARSDNEGVIVGKRSSRFTDPNIGGHGAERIASTNGPEFRCDAVRDGNGLLKYWFVTRLQPPPRGTT